MLLGFSIVGEASQSDLVDGEDVMIRDFTPDDFLTRD